MEKLQGIIREEVRSLHTREQLKSEKVGNPFHQIK
jgi:hypothetical protein